MLILNRDIKDKKPVPIGLSAIFGVGLGYGSYIGKKIGASKLVKASKLTREHIRMITRLVVRESLFETDLIRDVRDNIKYKIQNHSYKGRRHLMRLPVNGQRTKTNRRTARKLLGMLYEK